MSLFAFRFRVGSAGDEQRTDRLRRESIRLAIMSGIDDIDRELANVHERYGAALVSATSLCGTDVSDGFERESCTERELRAAEERALKAEQRIQQLERQRAQLERAKAELAGLFREGDELR